MWRLLRWVGVGAAALLIAALLATLAWGPGHGRPHGAKVGLVAPNAVLSVLDTSSQTDPGSESPLRTEIVRDRAVAHLAVKQRDLVAAVVVDLSGTEDVLLLDRSRNRDLQRSVRLEVARQEHLLGRTLRVESVNPHRAGAAETADSAVLWSLLAGFVLGMSTVVARWVRRRPLAGHLSRSVLVLVGGSLLIGIVSDWWMLGGSSDRPVSTSVLAVTALISALLPVGFAAAAEQIGLALALPLQLTLVLPVLLNLDDLMLPTPWSWFYPWTAPGAARTALSQEGPPPLWTVLALVLWLAASAVLAVAGRQARADSAAHLPLTRALTAATPAVIVLGLAAWLLPTDAQLPGDSTPLAGTSRCEHVGPLNSVRDLNRATRSLDSGDLIGGGDVGASTLLQDGRSLWLFGDSVRSPGKYPTFVRNSMLILQTDCLAIVLPHDNGAVIPNRADGVGYWPMSVSARSETGYDLVTVTAQRVRNTGSDVFDFEMLGPSVARFVVPRGGTPQLLQVTDLSRDRVDATRPMWGAASAAADGWLYSYGTAQSSEEGVFGYSLRVSRARPQDALDTSRWQYWDGSGWSGEEARATELIPAENGTSQTLSVWRGKGAGGNVWYALSKRNDFLGSDLVVWTAPAPTGPFTPHPTETTIPSDISTGELRYMPLAHPEILPKRGSVVVSYSNNRLDPEAVEQDPSVYRPTFLRVRLPDTAPNG